MPLKDGNLRDGLRNDAGEKFSDFQITFDDATFTDQLPSSAVARWKFNEGSGTTSTAEIGGYDATINGATWVSDTYQGDYALDGDGTDDDIDLGSTINDYIGSDLSGGLSMAITFETSDTGALVDFREPSSPPALAFDNGGAFGSSNMAVLWIDGNDNENVMEPDSSTNDGTRYRYVWTAGGPDPSNWDIYLNDSAASTTVTKSQHTNATLNLQNGFLLNIGGNSREIAATVDDFVVYDTKLTASEVTEDYNAQPWS